MGLTSRLAPFVLDERHELTQRATTRQREFSQIPM